MLVPASSANETDYNINKSVKPASWCCQGPASIGYFLPFRPFFNPDNRTHGIAITIAASLSVLYRTSRSRGHPPLHNIHYRMRCRGNPKVTSERNVKQENLIVQLLPARVNNARKALDSDFP